MTNAEVPSAGGQLSGESARNAAIKRLAKLQASSTREKKQASPGAGAPPVASYGGPPPVKG